MKRSLALAFALLAACGDDNPSTDDVTDDSGDSSDADGTLPDAAIDAPDGCDPATVLPTNYRLVAEVSTGAVTLTDAGGVKSGTIDATAGGLNGAADNPYIYVDLKTGTKVAVDDLAARTNTQWDIALKRSSLRTNSGDSGAGERELAVVDGESLAAVTAAPSTGYAIDDFADPNCELISIPGGEPMTAFGEWYNYNETTHQVSPKSEVYVIERPDGTHTAFRFTTYYGNPASPMSGANYAIELKQL